MSTNQTKTYIKTRKQCQKEEFKTNKNQKVRQMHTEIKEQKS